MTLSDDVTEYEEITSSDYNWITDEVVILSYRLNMGMWICVDSALKKDVMKIFYTYSVIRGIWALTKSAQLDKTGQRLTRFEGIQ